MSPRRSFWKTLSLVAAALLLAAGAFVWRLSVVAPVTRAAATPSLYDFTVPDLDGEAVPLSTWRGQVALVVNVASECGLAFQYPELDALYQRYRGRGFVVLAFPSNDFWQEPNDDAGIRQVCDTRGVSFPVFSKSHVRGPDQSPVYRFLGSTGEAPLWNFAKYLIGRDGRPRGFFGSLVSPDSPELLAAIERALAESVALEAGRD